MMLVATGWTYADLMATPVDVVVAVAHALAERNRQ
jgi:hypothetical protein